MPSASRPLARSAAVAACACLLGGGIAGCSTTQEKAERQQARAKHILEAQAKREKRNHGHHKSNKSDQKGSG